jgi:GNAT superfamily N-acetyltransferase
MSPRAEPRVTVRPARGADARRLAELRWEFRSPRAPAHESRGAFLRRASRWMADRLEERDRWRCWVAVRGRTIVGHVWVCLIEKIPNPGAEPERHAYLTNMYVQPGERGGTGSALLERALAWCDRQQVDDVILWPTPRSRPLYGRAGFRAARRLLARPGAR